MISPAHPDNCLCPVCTPGNVLAATGGWEWVDDGRPLHQIEQAMDAKEKQPRGWKALALDLLVLCGAVAVVWFTLFVCGVR